VSTPYPAATRRRCVLHAGVWNEHPCCRCGISERIRTRFWNLFSCWYI